MIFLCRVTPFLILRVHTQYFENQKLTITKYLNTNIIYTSSDRECMYECKKVKITTNSTTTHITFESVLPTTTKHPIPHTHWQNDTESTLYVHKQTVHEKKKVKKIKKTKIRHVQTPNDVPCISNVKLSHGNASFSLIYPSLYLSLCIDFYSSFSRQISLWLATLTHSLLLLLLDVKSFHKKPFWKYRVVSRGNLCMCMEGTYVCVWET